jgi:hypothetical protein
VTTAISLLTLALALVVTPGMVGDDFNFPHKEDRPPTQERPSTINPPAGIRPPLYRPVDGGAGARPGPRRPALPRG